VIKLIGERLVCTWVLVDELKKASGEGNPFAETLLKNWEYPLDLMFLSREGTFVTKLNSFRDLRNAHPDVGHHGDPYERLAPSHADVFMWHARHFLQLD
jgi:hypothetical protein